MPHYSAFTRYGHLRFSSKASPGELIYRALLNAQGGNYATEIGSRSEARTYALAMMLARVVGHTTRAANQMDPRRVTDLLPVQEAIYGIVPGLNDSIFDREAALIAKRVLPQGARYTAVTAALTAAIGADFLYYYVTKRADISTYPASPGAATGPGNWVAPDSGIEVVRLTSAVSLLGAPVTAHYAALDPGGVSRISKGDAVVMSANNIGLAERVIVADASASAFTATFTKAHDVGDICTTALYPYWVSNQQHVLVVVTPAAALDPEKRRKVNDVMKQIMRTWVQWDIVPSADGLVTAGFKIDDPVLGRTDYAAIEGVTFP